MNEQRKVLEDAAAAQVAEWNAQLALLEAKAQNKTLTDTELLDAIEAMAKALPELVTETTVEDIAKISEANLADALVAGIAGRQTADAGRPAIAGQTPDRTKNQ